MEITNTIDISANIERVWDLTVDVESWPLHTPTITSVDRLEVGEFRVNSTARVKQPGQPSRTWTVSEMAPMRRFAWVTAAMGTTMTGVHELEPIAGGTRNTLKVVLEGGSAWFTGRALAPVFRRAIVKENLGFKAAAERPEHPAAPGGTVS